MKFPDVKAAKWGRSVLDMVQQKENRRLGMRVVTAEELGAYFATMADHNMRAKLVYRILSPIGLLDCFSPIEGVISIMILRSG